MWRKISLIFILSFALTSCSSPEEKLEGYWLDENGSSLSFNNTEKTITQDGFTYDYSIFDENKLSISFWGLTETFEFKISSDTLTLTKLSDYSTNTYYKNSQKQTEIREKLNLIAEEEKQQAALEQAEKEYNSYIQSLKDKLRKIDHSIQSNYEWINNEKSWIDLLEEDIADVYEDDYYDADELAATFREQQDQCYANISQYKQEITDLEIQKNEIIETLKSLGEY